VLKTGSLKPLICKIKPYLEDKENNNNKDYSMRRPPIQNRSMRVLERPKNYQ
jgi:hypothetical protein